MNILLKLNKLFCSSVLLFCFGVNVASAQEKIRSKLSPDSQSLIANVRLAARGSDFKLAQKRLDALARKKDLQAIGSMAIAVEYAKNGDVDLADEYVGNALELLRSEKMLTRDRVNAYLQIAKLMNESERYIERSEEIFDLAVDSVSTLAGIDFNIAMTEMVYTSLDLFGDKEQAIEFASLIGDQKWRDNLVKLISATNQEN